MPEIKSHLAISQFRSIFEKAMSAERGIRISCGSHGEAVKLRVNLNRFRKQDRDMNSKVYSDPSDPRHGISDYDVFELVIPKENDKVIEIRRRGNGLAVEEI